MQASYFLFGIPYTKVYNSWSCIGVIDYSTAWLCTCSILKYICCSCTSLYFLSTVALYSGFSLFHLWIYWLVCVHYFDVIWASVCILNRCPPSGCSGGSHKYRSWTNISMSLSLFWNWKIHLECIFSVLILDTTSPLQTSLHLQPQSSSCTLSTRWRPHPGVSLGFPQGGLECIPIKTSMKEGQP